MSSTLNPGGQGLEGGFVVVLLTLSPFDTVQDMVYTTISEESASSQNKTASDPRGEGSPMRQSAQLRQQNGLEDLLNVG